MKNRNRNEIGEWEGTTFKVEVCRLQKNLPVWAESDHEKKFYYRTFIAQQTHSELAKPMLSHISIGKTLCQRNVVNINVHPSIVVDLVYKEDAVINARKKSFLWQSGK